MTGAGSGSVAYALEDDYLGGPGDNPTYYEPGTNVQVETAELSRNLLEILAPGDVEAQKLLAQNLGGQLDVSWVMNSDDFHRLLFNDNSTGFGSNPAVSAEWYLGVDYYEGTTERQLKGWAPGTAQAAYNGPTETVRVTLSGAYGDEEKNTDVTPGTLESGSDEVPGHGASLTINGVPLTKLQTATLSFENIARLQPGPSPHPVDAVPGNVSTSLDMTNIYTGPEQYELALGSSGATEFEDTIEEVEAELAFDVDGSEVASYTIAGVAPETYDWQDLVTNDPDMTESITWMGHGVTGSDPTA